MRMISFLYPISVWMALFSLFIYFLVDHILSILPLSILLQAVANSIASVSISVCYRQPTQRPAFSPLAAHIETRIRKNEHPVSKAIAKNAHTQTHSSSLSLNKIRIVPSHSCPSFAVYLIYILLRTCVNILLANKFICQNICLEKS